MFFTNLWESRIIGHFVQDHEMNLEDSELMSLKKNQAALSLNFHQRNRINVLINKKSVAKIQREFSLDLGLEIKLYEHNRVIALFVHKDSSKNVSL